MRQNRKSLKPGWCTQNSALASTRIRSSRPLAMALWLGLLGLNVDHRVARILKRRPLCVQRHPHSRHCPAPSMSVPFTSFFSAGRLSDLASVHFAAHLDSLFSSFPGHRVRAVSGLLVRDRARSTRPPPPASSITGPLLGMDSISGPSNYHCPGYAGLVSGVVFDCIG